MKETTKKKIVKWFWILVAAPFVLVFLLLLLVGIFAKIPSFEELEHPDNKLATQVIAEDGEVLATFHIENRTYVSYDELSPYLVQAAVSTEDARFYKHSGIDMKGLARVLFSRSGSPPSRSSGTTPRTRSWTCTSTPSSSAAAPTA